MRLFLFLFASAAILGAADSQLPVQAHAILSAQCFGCHAGTRTMGSIGLDSREALRNKGSSGKPVLVPGNPGESELIRRVKSADPRTRMPFGQKPLAEDQVAILENWIRQGGELPNAAAIASGPATPWAYRPLAKATPPAVRNQGWVRNPVDAFVLAAMEEKGISPSKPASRQTLIRRLSFDLAGLPPSPEDVEKFVSNSSPRASDELADQLLASPRFGERWGRHWLDLARYADSEGYENDKDALTMYRYRDFVIQAVNSDMPFDQFVRWQLAGDEFAPHNRDALVATGLLTAGPRLRTAASDSAENKERYLYDQLDDIVSTISVAFLATTAGCARCHDHKYDPVSTRDYYRLVAAFRNIDRDEKPLSREHWVRDRWLRQRRAALREERMAALSIPESDRELLRWPLNRNHSGQAAAYKEWNARLLFSDAEFAEWLGEGGRKRLAELNRAVAQQESSSGTPANGTFFLDSGSTPEPSYLLARGDVTKKAEPLQFGFLSALTRGKTPEEYRKPLVQPEADTTFRRAALAEWLVDVDQGAGTLLARVAVNRLWQHHFGQGLVRTADDFGMQGEKPSNAALLDWLAGELIRNGWHLKPIHRLIVTSATYLQSSAYDAGTAAIDPDVRLEWRHRPQRIEAETLRDSVLAVSGALNLTMYGPPVRPFIPTDAIATRTADPWPKGIVDGPELWRRSVYLFVKRSVRMPLMETFDVPDPNTACGRRLNTTLPTQSLALLNDGFIRDQARRFAGRVAAIAGTETLARVRAAYRLALAREPSSYEESSAERFLQAGSNPEETLTDLCHALFNLNEFSYVD